MPRDATELNWVLAQSRHTVWFYDKGQSVRPSDVDAERFMSLLEQGPVFDLATQHRSRGGIAFTRFVRELLYDRWQTRVPFDTREGFEIGMFEDFGEMVAKIKAHDDDVGLSRLVAGFAWPWASKSDKTAIDMVIDGVEMQWNMTAKSWINSPTAVNEVGCIHTTQGYDLNYVGVVFGHEIGYDSEAERIVVYRDRYHDKKGKQGVDTDERLANYIKQIYYTILCRGIRGVYVYVCDPALRDHLRGFFLPAEPVRGQVVAAEHSEEATRQEAKIISFEEYKKRGRAVRYYDVRVAAGAFSEQQQVGAEEEVQVIELPDTVTIGDPDEYFVCRIEGESMNRVVPSGALALFRRHVGGSRDGKYLLLAHSDFVDSEFGAGLTLKRYRSEKVYVDGTWTHSRVTLEPVSDDESYEPIVLEAEQVGELRVLGEFIATV